MNDVSQLPAEERDRKYSARELIDLALAGHFCIRDTINRSIHEIYRAHGARGRERMNRLPALKAYATQEEIDGWERELLDLADNLRDEVKVRQHPTERSLFD